MVNELLGHLKAQTEVVKALVLLLQLTTMLIDIAQIGSNNDRLGCQLTMILGVLQLVGHNASTAINQTMLVQGVIFQRVGKMHTIGTHQFTTLQTV